MDWNARVDLFEQLRREHEFGIGTVAGVAANFGVHRRMVRQAIAGAVSLGACDVAAVRYLLTEAGLHKAQPDPVDVGALARYDRPLPTTADYDVLLRSSPCAGTA